MKYILLLSFLLPLSTLAQEDSLVFERFDKLPLGSRSVQGMTLDHRGTLWITTDLGILGKGKDDQLNHLIDSLDMDMFDTGEIIVDPQGNKWAATHRQSVIRFKSNGEYEEISFKDSTFTQDQQVLSMSISQQQLWIGTDKGKIISLDLKDNSIGGIPSVYEGPVYSLYTEGNRVKLVGRGNGLFLNIKPYEKWKEFRNLLEVYKIVKVGKLFWIIAKDFENKMALFSSQYMEDWQRNMLDCLSASGKRIRFNDFDMDNEGNIWIAYNNGIVKYDTTARSCYIINRNSFPEFGMKSVTHIIAENDSTIWVGSETAGLYKIRVLDKPEPEEVVSVRKSLTSLEDINCVDTLLLDQLLFRPSQAEFLNRRDAEAFLDIMVEYLKMNPNNTIDLFGHTDNISDNKEYLLELSQSRVETVKKYLSSKGVRKSRISTEAFGGEKPIITKGSLEGRKKNRRVEVKVNCN